MINRDLLIIKLRDFLNRINTDDILRIMIIKFFTDKIDYLKDVVLEEILRVLVDKWINNFLNNVEGFKKINNYDYIYVKYNFKDKKIYYNVSNKYLKINDLKLSKSDRNDLVINEFKIMFYKEIENIINITVFNSKVLSNGFYINLGNRYPECGGDFSDIIDVFSENEVCKILKLDSKFKKYIGSNYYIYEPHISKRNSEVIGYVDFLKQVIRK